MQEAGYTPDEFREYPPQPQKEEPKAEQSASFSNPKDHSTEIGNLTATRFSNPEVLATNPKDYLRDKINGMKKWLAVDPSSWVRRWECSGLPRLEEIWKDDDKEALQEIVEADMRYEIGDYTLWNEEVEIIQSENKTGDYDNLTARLAQKRQELNALTGDNETEREQRKALLADIAGLNNERRATDYGFALARRDEAESKIAQLFQLRQQLAPKPPASSPNTPVDATS